MKCLCSIENGRDAYVYPEDCPVHGNKKFVCKWCGTKQKSSPTGLCPVCCRF